MSALRHAFNNWWSKMSPYYTKAYTEVYVGLAIMTYLYTKISYGERKPVKDKPAH